VSIYEGRTTLCEGKVNGLSVKCLPVLGRLAEHAVPALKRAKIVISQIIVVAPAIWGNSILGFNNPFLKCMGRLTKLAHKWSTGILDTLLSGRNKGTREPF